jgi:transposase InsO family protein
LDDFLEPPKPSNLLIKGFNGATATTKVGTVQWPLQDDQGRVHKITLPHTYYSKHAEHRLLSPQHWAQVANQGKGTRCITYHDSIVLIWGNDKYRKTVPLSPSNVGVMSTPPGMLSYLHICQQATCPIISFPTTIYQELPTVTDSEEELTSDRDDKPSPMHPLLDRPTESTKTSSPQVEPCTQREVQHHARYEPRTRPLSKERQDTPRHNPTILDEQQEYMRWHYKLNHASQKVMTRMANKGMLPSYITRILKTMDKQCRKGPICNDCYGASAARTPWRAKPNQQMKQTEDRRASLSPGDVVSVDQLETSTPGFISQITGILPRQRIVGSTIFVNQASNMGYVHHHLSMSSEETVRAKESFERHAKSYGVNIKHYHADNERFKDKAFMKTVEDSGQTISFSGVGAHHQNGISEKRIGDLQRRATTLLLHAQRRWSDAITTYLWPYALRAANDSRNNTPTAKSNECPMSRFCRTARVPKLRHQHHFGCPVHVLSKDMQDGKKAGKWEDRTRVGINLGHLPRHAHSVSLILNIKTGLVSPQFHFMYDDLFETTTGTQSRSISKAQWQYKAGLITNEGDQDTPEEDQEGNSKEDREDEGGPILEQQDIPRGQYITRSGRVSKAPERLGMTTFESILEPYDYEEWDEWCEKDLFAFKASEQVSMKASTDPDNMYYHQAMREPDKEMLKEAIRKECEDHFRESNYKLISI